MSRGQAATSTLADSTPSPPPWSAGRWKWLRLSRLDRGLLAIAALLQIALASVPLPPSYDRMVFTATGYLVGTGHSPYSPQHLSPVFDTAVMREFATIGYPPPWPLVLGVVYRLAHALTPDLDFYAFAVKLPVIAAALGLAYLAGTTVQNLGATPRVARRTWFVLLFNPFLIYVASVRGQIDPIVALLALAALLLLASGRPDFSAVMLALAVCFKPIAAPLVVAVLLYAGAVSPLRALRVAAVFGGGVFTFYLLPFLVFGWDAAPLSTANAQFSLTGAMSPATIARLWADPVVLPGHWWLLGLAWIPAILIAAVIGRRTLRDVAGLLAFGVALTLVFFLLRPFLAETNVVLLLAPVLILAAIGCLDRRLYVALWVLPFVMTLSYLWPVKLLWAAAPGVVARATAWADRSSPLLLAAQIAVIVAWQVAGWLTVRACLHHARLAMPAKRSAGPWHSSSLAAASRPDGREPWP